MQMRERNAVLDGVEYVARMRFRVRDGEEYIRDDDLGEWEDAITRLVVKHGARGPQAVKWLRKSCRLKQEELAKLLGVNRSTVVRWEMGEVQIPVITWAVLANLCTDRSHMESLLHAANTGPQAGRIAS